MLMGRRGKTGGAGRVGFGSGQSGCGSNGSRVESGRESGRVDSYFSNNFFFFFWEIDAICQLFMSSLTMIRFSLMILVPIITKYLA